MQNEKSLRKMKIENQGVAGLIPTFLSQNPLGILQGIITWDWDCWNLISDTKLQKKEQIHCLFVQHGGSVVQ